MTRVCGERLVRESEPRSPLAVDAVAGNQVSFEQLSRAMFELTGFAATIELVGQARGTRACPSCNVTMTKCMLCVTFETEPPSPSFEVQRCEQHGMWFERGELLDVFANVCWHVPATREARRWLWIW